MSSLTKKYIKVFSDAELVTKDKDLLETFRNLNSRFLETGEMLPGDKLQVPTLSGIKTYKVTSMNVTSFLIAEYKESKNQFARDTLASVVGKRLSDRSEDGKKLKSLTAKLFGVDRPQEQEQQEEQEEGGEVSVEEQQEGKQKKHKKDMNETGAKLREESRKRREEAQERDRQGEEEKIEFEEEEAPQPQPKSKGKKSSQPKPAVDPLPEQSEPSGRSGRTRIPTTEPEVVDEPRTISAILAAVKSFSKIDFSKDSPEDRIDQIEAIFDTVDNLVSSKALSEDEIPEEIRSSTKQGLEVIRSSVKEGKSKSSIFDKVKGIAKSVLGFISFAPIPIPPQIKAAAGTILVGVQAIEQTKKVVETVASGGTDISTDQIKAGIDIIRESEDLAPAAEFADGVISAVEGAIEVKKALFGEQKGKDASESTPVPSEYAEPDFETTVQQEQSTIDDHVKSSGGIVTEEEISDAKARTVQEPINVGGTIITPEKAQELATDKEDTIRIDQVVQEEMGNGGPPSNDSSAGGDSSEIPSEGEQSATQSQNVQTSILQGNNQVQGVYENPVHPDAIGIFFGNSNFPKWNDTLLADRDRRYADLTPEETKPFLLQQSRMIFEKHGADLMIPRLMYDESSDGLDVKRENFEIMQIWAKLKDIGSPSGESDIVGVRLGDLLKFRGLISSDEGPTASNPLSEKEPGESEGATLPSTRAIPQGPGPQLDETKSNAASDHPKDTTKNFVYNPGAVRISPVVSDAEARKAARPSLSEMVTLEGNPQMRTRRNLTRGNTHAGPQLRTSGMDGLRRSAMGTVSSEYGVTSRGRALYTNKRDLNVKVRM